MATIPTYKELAVFGKGNIEQVKQIVAAKSDISQLSRIPPSFIIIDLTWRCNYKCLDCIDAEAVNKISEDMPVELIEDIFDYSKIKNVRGIMTMGGEVFLHNKGIRKALRKSVETRIPLKIVSNGSCLERHVDDVAEAFKIPGSVLRVSVNAGREHYQQQTGSKTNLEDVFYSIERITSQGTPVSVSTVVFPASSKKDGTIPNVKSLPEIIKYCEYAKIERLILLPSRNPFTKGRYELTDDEKIQLEKIKGAGYDLNIEIGSFSKQDDIGNQNLDFTPCPSGFIFTLIGSDGKVYKCSDNRGRDSMVIGEVHKKGDFEKFWHSQERVEKQFETKCENSSCVRYRVNCLLDNACRLYRERGVDLVPYLEQLGGIEAIFV